MKPTKIIYQETIPTGNYANQKLGIEIELGETDGVIETFKTAQILVRQAFREMNPNYGEVHAIRPFGEQNHEVERGKWEMKLHEIQVNPKQQQISNFKEAITTCTSMKALEMFKKLVDRENIPELTEAYINKLKSFQ